MNISKLNKTIKTLNEAIETIYSDLTLEDIEIIKKDDFTKYHFTVGMALRNQLELWKEDSPVKKDVSKRFGLSHGDDCSGLIFAGVWAKVRNQDIEKQLNSTANYYKQHWEDSGINPLTMEPI